MIIAEKLFRLESVDENTPRFNLELLYVVNKGKSNERMEFKQCGYGLTLDYAIKKIAHYMVELKHKDTAIKLKQYFSDFKTAIDELTKSLREIS